MADVLADEIVAGDAHHMTFAHVAEPVQDLGHAQCDGRFAGAGIAGEAHMQGRGACFQAQLLARARHREIRRDLADTPLHRRQADQLAVELVEHFGHVRIANDGLQVDGGDRLACWRVRGVHDVLLFSDSDQ